MLELTQISLALEWLHQLQSIHTVKLYTNENRQLDLHITEMNLIFKK